MSLNIREESRRLSLFAIRQAWGPISKIIPSLQYLQTRSKSGAGRLKENTSGDFDLPSIMTSRRVCLPDEFPITFRCKYSYSCLAGARERLPGWSAS